MAEQVRLVIWDLDETFWHGTLTEGGVTPRAEAVRAVEVLAGRGIVSSLCSRNDRRAVQAVLARQGAWYWFVFPSIDWGAKGPRLRRLVDTAQLRPESVLFIDDNPLNLAEARQAVPGIQVASEAIVLDLLDDPRLAGKDDRALSRWRQYKSLEARKADQGRARAEGGDNRAFLRESDIRIRIEHDVEAHLDRAVELVNRTNQLNFTKRRLPEDPAEARHRLREELSRFDIQAGLIHVSDRYGDHGHCGFFQVRTRREAVELRHFCFSCRVLGMGVEAWVYQRLGRPALRIRGKTLSDPASDPVVDWITREERPTAPAAPTVPTAPSLGSVMLRGGCALWPLAHYFRLCAPSVTGEFNLVRDSKLIRLDHSVCLRQALEGVTPAQSAATAPLGFVPEDFATGFLHHAGERPIWIFQNWADLFMPVIRHRETGVRLPYHRPRDGTARAGEAVVEPYADHGFEPSPYGEAEIKDSLHRIFSRVPARGLLFLLLIPEVAPRQGPDTAHPRRVRGNRWFREAAAPFPNVRPVRLEPFIRSAADYANENGTHFDRAVYHRLFDHLHGQAAEAESGS